MKSVPLHQEAEEGTHSSPNETDDIVILSPEHSPDEDEHPPPDDIQWTSEVFRQMLVQTIS